MSFELKTGDYIPVDLVTEKLLNTLHKNFPRIDPKFGTWEGRVDWKILRFNGTCWFWAEVGDRKISIINVLDAISTRGDSASEFINKAAKLMEERGKDYDEDGGERSAGKTVTAFNAITGHNLTEAEGWLFMQILKDVRQWTTPTFHRDSAEDCVTYAALKAEALSAGLTSNRFTKS